MVPYSRSSSCKSSIAEGTVCVHVTTHVRQLWNVVVAREHRRQDGGRWVGTMAKCRTATDERASQPWSRRSGYTGSKCSWRSTGVYERRLPVTRRAAAFWTDCNRGTSVLLTCGRTESCSSPGDRRRTPGQMFYSHLQTMTGQPAVAGAAGSRLFDRPQRREPNVTAGHILLMVLWNQAKCPISNGFRDIQRQIWRDGWHDLKRPLNKGHGHFISFVW